MNGESNYIECSEVEFGLSLGYCIFAKIEELC